MSNISKHLSEVRHLSVSIAVDVALAYRFLSEPLNFPQWATGLGELRKAGTQWIVETPDGPMHVRFSAKNAFGVLDHWVVPASGREIYIPLRLLANGAGCELLFTLFRQPDMTDDKFDADAEWVKRDLSAAKTLLERMTFSLAP